ncbi:MAG: phosphatidate cytidylyltransferase, partial [bacterium]
MTQDLQALAISFGYVAVVLLLAEAIRRQWQLPLDFTRKFVHIAIGTWSIPTFHLFVGLGWAITPPLLFVAINFASYKLKFFQAIEEESGDNLGTILFPASFAILLAIFWNLPDRTPA